MNFKEKMKYIFYSDIEPLEIFQSALLILVNPVNLYHTECSTHSDITKYLLGLGIACAIVSLIVPGKK